MAVSKFKKIELVGLRKDKKDFLALLQRLGRVELIAIEEPVSQLNISLETGEMHLVEIEEAIAYLASYQQKSGFLESIVGLKPLVYQEQLQEVITSFDYQDLIEKLNVLRNHLRNFIQHREKLIEERDLLTDWQKLKLPLDEPHTTETCAVLCGVLPTADYAKLQEDFQKEKLNLFFEVINQDKASMYLVIIYLQEEFEHLDTVLKNYHFNFVTLGRHKGLVVDRLLEINRELLVLDDQLKDLKNKIFNLSKERFKLMIIYDYLLNIRKRQEIDKDLSLQKFTFSLSGWVKEKDLKNLEQIISDKFKGVAIFISQTKAGEEIPIDLENNRLIQPFEFITKIYGFPKYNELDPTPFLAPFFFLYFGFCVSDVGYGFILASFSWWVLKKFRLGPQGLRFFRLFLFCGISTIIIGALTGSCFGNLFDLLAESHKIFIPLRKFKDTLVILDPLKEPTKLLGLALSFGIIQVWFGNIVAGMGNFKNKRYLDIILDQLPKLTFLFGLTGLGLIFLKLLDTTHINLFRYATLLAAIVLIFTQGRAEKNIGARLFFGIYNLYTALSGYLSDILSYSRLWALGLVTGVMAGTINLIALQCSQIIPSVVPSINKIGFIKILISSVVLVTIFIFGHAVSFLMNLLGAFVHPLRLQFVEFFSKFFKGGGSTFKPFKVETKYINLS